MSKFIVVDVDSVESKVPTADAVAEIIEEYCTTHPCPVGCPFDIAGVCTQENPFNTVYDRYRMFLKEGDKS